MKTFLSSLGIGLLVIAGLLLGWKIIIGMVCLLFGISTIYGTSSKDYNSIIERAKRISREQNGL